MKKKVTMLFCLTMAGISVLAQNGVNSSSSSNNSDEGVYLSWRLGQVYIPYMGKSTGGKNNSDKPLPPIVTLAKTDDVNIFPNPTHGEVTIRSEEVKRFRLLSAAGQVLEEKDFDRHYKLDLRNYPGSEFFIELGGKTYKVIKQ